MTSKYLLVFVLMLIYSVAFSKAEWDSFKREHSKFYETPAHEAHHLQTFVDNKHKIDEHNLHYDNGIAPFKMGLNKYSDLTHDEFIEKMSGHKADKDVIDDDDKSTLFVAPHNFQPPKSVDWRKMGAVTGVKDQNLCSAGWAMSASSAIESQYFRKTGRLLSLSDQNLIDCSGLYGSEGCDGGFPEQAFQYIRDHGIYTEEAYPYDGRANRFCKLSIRDVKKANITVRGFSRISSGNEEDLQKALAIHGPISVSIDASHRSLFYYAQGIYEELDCSSDDDDLSHSVLLVGYGTDEFKRDYYILKNNWGENWGEAGYFRMPRNRANHCGIATRAVFPNI